LIYSINPNNKVEAKPNSYNPVFSVNQNQINQENHGLSGSKVKFDVKANASGWR
jgi:hypothetical protein